MRSRSAVLTNQELEIMKIVWDHESPTVRNVYEALLKRLLRGYGWKCVRIEPVNEPDDAPGGDP